MGGDTHVKVFVVQLTVAEAVTDVGRMMLSATRLTVATLQASWPGIPAISQAPVQPAYVPTW